jgi:hypothetical protein
MLVGGLGAIGLYYAPLVQGGFDERVLAWLAAGAIAWRGARRATGVLG